MFHSILYRLWEQNWKRCYCFQIDAQLHNSLHQWYYTEIASKLFNNYNLSSWLFSDSVCLWYWKSLSVWPTLDQTGSCELDWIIIEQSQTIVLMVLGYMTWWSYNDFSHLDIIGQPNILLHGIHCIFFLCIYLFINKSNNTFLWIVFL